MLKETVWICEKCNARFTSEEDADKHAASHIIDDSIKEKWPPKFEVGDIVKLDRPEDAEMYKVQSSFPCFGGDVFWWRHKIGYDCFMKPIVVDESKLKLVMKKDKFLEFFDKMKSLMQEYGFKTDDFALGELVDLYGLGID